MDGTNQLDTDTHYTMLWLINKLHDNSRTTFYSGSDELRCLTAHLY